MKTFDNELTRKDINYMTSNTIKNIAARLFQDSLLTRYRLSGYVVKKSTDEIVLEDHDKIGWYVKVHENTLDIYEEGLLKRRVGPDYECVWSHWPNGKLCTEVWKDLMTGLITDVKKYTEKGTLVEDVKITRDSSGEIVREYVQTFWHTEKNVDKKNGKLIKTTEFWNDIVDKCETLCKRTVLNEHSTVMYERVQTVDDDITIEYGEHEKLGNVVQKVENCDFKISLIYVKEGIGGIVVEDKRFVENLPKVIYFKETCRDREVMTDWERVLEFVEKKKYKKLMLKSHWYDFGDRKLKEMAEKVCNSRVRLECVEIEDVVFVKGSLCEQEEDS